MNFKTTIALVALLAVVAAYLYFVVLNAPEPGDARPATATKTDGEPLLPDALPSAREGTTITIERDDQAVTLRREKDNWFEIEPVRFPAERLFGGQSRG